MSDDKVVIDTLIQEHIARLISVITTEVPDSNSSDTRDAWLTSIRGKENVRRDRGRASSDLRLIFNELDNLPLGEDHWALESFVENIIQEYKDYPVAVKLQILIDVYVSLKKGQSDLEGKLLVKEVEQNIHQQTQGDVEKKHELENLLAPVNFDLRILSRECVNKILKMKGPVGFSIPYDSYPFLVNFCERVKIDLGRKKTHKVKTPLDLKPHVLNVDRAISRIMGYIDELETGDVICPVQAPPSDNDIIDDFWQKIKDHFKVALKYCLIVIMVGNPDYIFPVDVFQLNAPKLEIVDLHEWVRDIGTILDLPDYVVDIWRTEMERQCRNGDALELEEAYHHINMTKELLNAYPKYNDFLSNFLKRSMNLEGISPVNSEFSSASLSTTDIALPNLKASPSEG